MDLRQRVGELVARVTDEEWNHRAKAGLPVHHVLARDEFPLKFAKPVLAELLSAASAWRSAQPDEPLAALVLSQAQALAGHYVEADATLEAYHRLTGDPMGAMRYAAPIPAPARAMPSVSGAWPRGPAFFLSCDERYWKLFALPLVRSIAHLAPGAPVHAHIMGSAPSAAADVDGLGLAFSMTWEDPSAFIAASGIRDVDYFNAARFVRFAEALHGAEGPLCILDVDALAHRDPMSVFGIDADLALRARAGRMEQVHQFSACLVLARAAARGYLDTVADIIRGALHAPFWGLDQFALHAAFVRARPEIRFLGPAWADVEETDAGVFWFTAGKAKTRLKTDATPYARLFRRYWTQGAVSGPVTR